MGSMITANYDSETDQIIDASPRLNNGVANSSVTVTATPSGPGLEIETGSDTRSFLTAEMSGGVPTGNFL